MFRKKRTNLPDIVTKLTTKQGKKVDVFPGKKGKTRTVRTVRVDGVVKVAGVKSKKSLKKEKEQKVKLDQRGW